MGCIPGSKAVEKYIHKLTLLNSRDYTNEVEFCGDINTFLSYKINPQLNYCVKFRLKTRIYCSKHFADHAAV